MASANRKGCRCGLPRSRGYSSSAAQPKAAAVETAASVNAQASLRLREESRCSARRDRTDAAHTKTNPSSHLSNKVRSKTKIVRTPHSTDETFQQVPPTALNFQSLLTAFPSPMTAVGICHQTDIQLSKYLPPIFGNQALTLLWARGMVTAVAQQINT